MNIKGFKIKNQKIQKIWIIVMVALIVAISLIAISFFIVFKKSSNVSLNKEDLFNYSSYYAKYNVVTYSNKNQNLYAIEEYCMRNNDEYKFRFNSLNESNNYSYIIDNGYFYIKSDNQINVFEGYSNINSNTNILSLATFIDIYTKIDKMIEENNKNLGIKLEIEENDEKISYNIIFEDKIESSSEILEYEEQLINNMKISKFELILGIDSKKPIEYIVYLDNGNAYIDIIYDEVKINTKFDEKVFSF